MDSAAADDQSACRYIYLKAFPQSNLDVSENGEDGEPSKIYKGVLFPHHEEPAFAIWGHVPHVFQETTWEPIHNRFCSATSITINGDRTIVRHISPPHGWLSEQVECKFWIWVKAIREELPAKMINRGQYINPSLKLKTKEHCDMLEDLLLTVFPVDLPTIYRKDPAVFNFLLNAYHGRACKDEDSLWNILRKIDRNARVQIALLGLFIVSQMIDYYNNVQYDSMYVRDVNALTRLQVTRRNIEKFVMKNIYVFLNFMEHSEKYFERYCGGKKYLEPPAERFRPAFLLRTWRKKEHSKILDPYFLAYKAKSETILSHYYTQYTIQKRWRENSRKILPIPCYTTQIKYYFHMFSQIVYILLFINVLVRKPSRIMFEKMENGTYQTVYHSLTSTLENGYSILDAVGVHWREVFIFLFQLTHLLDMLTNLLYTRLVGSKLYNKLDISYNGVNLMNFIIYICLAFRVNFTMLFPWSQTVFAILFSVSDLLYLISFILAFVILMSFTGKFQLFGSISRILQKSFSLCIRYMPVFGALWIIYATVYIHISDQQDSSNYVAWMMIQTGLFEIFGEITKDNDPEGQIDGCFNSSLSEVEFIDVPTMRCFFRRTLVPILLFCYMLLSSVMLVNLLTAMLSQAYEEIRKESEWKWKCDNYRLLLKCEEMSEFPPPFTLLVYAIRAVEFLIYSCCFPPRKLLAWICPDCGCECDCWSRLCWSCKKHDLGISDVESGHHVVMQQMPAEIVNEPTCIMASTVNEQLERYVCH